jgi:hypothetical protein
MTAFQLNPDAERRDILIFGAPLDWQGETMRQKRVRFGSLSPTLLSMLLREGFLEGDASQNNPVAPQALLDFAEHCVEAGLRCEFEGAVSSPEQHQSVLIARVWVKGKVTQEMRAAFWQLFQQVDILQISWFELRATWGEEWLYNRVIASRSSSDGNAESKT